MNPRSVVFVSQHSLDKDLSDARRYGELKYVFLGPVWDPKTIQPALNLARENMRTYQEQDYLLMIGDPLCCAATVVIALEYSESQVLNILRWDKKIMGYKVLTADFGDGDVPMEWEQIRKRGYE